MNIRSIFKFSQGLPVLFGVVTLLLACNGGVVDPGGGTATYRLKGLVTVDPNRGKTLAVAEFRTDTGVVATGTVKLDATFLTFNRLQFAIDSVYSIEWNSIIQLGAGNHTLIVSDSSRLSSQLVTTYLPGPDSITGITPSTRLANGSEQVKLDWFGGSGASGFVIAAVLATNAYTGKGYSLYVTSGSNSATFPRDAFYQSNPTTPDTGWYYLYVYAYSGAPDSVLSGAVLPVRMPSQLADNIVSHDLAGHAGVVRVAVRDSVRIAIQP
jgi:hypothetical protein